MLIDRPTSTEPRFSDRLKFDLLVRMRRSHERTLQRSSVRTYRRRVVPTDPPPRLVPAARVYPRMGWLPPSLVAPERLPSDAKLPPRYVAPYYGTSKLGWWLYGRRPIDPALEWTAASDWNRPFGDVDEVWDHPTSDAAFVALRLQGPNPFMLRRVADVDETARFELDFTELFDGVFMPTVAHFHLDDDRLTPTWIRLGDRVIHQGDADWTLAKAVVNALDARTATFIRHLLNTHLMVGQAFALAAYTLPPWHALRPFMDFFTYGSLQVNHFAYAALLTPDSYFLRSNFVRPDDAQRLIENATATFDFDEWLLPKDLAKRGIDAIPGHPYVEDGRKVWPLIERVVDAHLEDVDLGTDDDVLDDPDLAAWYAVVRRVLPGSESVPRLRGVDDLRDLMTGLIYNNVIHEVCGNLAPLLDSEDPIDRGSISFEHLRDLVDPEREPGPVRAADVFLMDQASFVSTLNVAGNNLMTVNAARYVDDPRLRRTIEHLQADLRELDAELTKVNAGRAVPFTTMQPRKWEASISY